MGQEGIHRKIPAGLVASSFLQQHNRLVVGVQRARACNGVLLLQLHMHQLQPTQPRLNRQLRRDVRALHDTHHLARLIPIARSELTNRVYSCVPYTQKQYLRADENSQWTGNTLPKNSTHTTTTHPTPKSPDASKPSPCSDAAHRPDKFVGIEIDAHYYAIANKCLCVGFSTCPPPNLPRGRGRSHGSLPARGEGWGGGYV